MADQRKRDYKDPYPITLEGVYEELDYWSTRQGEGVPTSFWEEGVKGRLEHLRDLERRFRDQGNKIQSAGDTVFISCGQLTDSERALGREVCKLVEKLTPYKAYFADAQSSLDALTENVLSRLNQCVGFIAILHARGEVTLPSGIKHTRGSVWVEQEIAIAAFIAQVLKTPIKVAAYISRSIKREGMREQLHLNPVLFGDDREVLDSLRSLLPTWRGTAKGLSPVKLEITYNKKRITQERHDYELVVTLVNTGTTRIEKYEVDVLFPNLFLEQGTSSALEVPCQRTKTHRFFRVTEATKREPLCANSPLPALTVSYFVDHDIFWSHEGALDQSVIVTFYGENLEPVKVEKKMRELQIF